MRIANDEKGSCRCLILVTIQELRKIAKNEGILSEGEIFVRKLADKKEQCCTLNAKFRILAKRKKIV